MLFIRTGDFALSVAHEQKAAKFAGPITLAGIEIPLAEQSPLVLALLAVIEKQDAEIQELRDEIQRLKKTTTRPKITPSRMLKPPPSPESKDGSKKKRPGSQKRKKTKDLRIDSAEIIHPDGLPPDAKLEGYRDFVVQDLVQTHQNHVTQGRLLEKLTELGVDISAGKLSSISLEGHHLFHAEKRLCSANC